MRRGQFRNVLLLCAFLCGLGLLPGASRAQAATPVPLHTDFPPEFCSPEEIADGDMNIEESPEETLVVSPANAPNMDLYVVKIKLPAHSCVSFSGHNLHDGAVLWLVDSGTVEFDFQFLPNWPFPDLAFHLKDENVESVPGVTKLEEGDWVSADRAVHYSYRNPTDSEAIIIMTVLENRVIFTGSGSAGLGFGAGCKGVCRRR
jgi:hypothetical protein